MEVLKNFLYRVADAPADLDGRSGDRGAGRADPRAGRLRAGALRALRGGVDSAVAALLVHKAVGDQLTCVFVDHGLLREGRGRAGRRDASTATFTFRSSTSTPTSGSSHGSRASTDPERSATRIGEEFIRVFEDEARKLGDVRLPRAGDALLGRDRVGRHRGRRREDQVAPQRRRPARGHGRWSSSSRCGSLFKDEVRRVGEELGLPERMVWRHPFPGPGLAIRIIGDVTAGAARDPARGRRDPARRDPARRPLPRALAVLRGAARDPLGRRPGRRAHVRVSDRDPRRHLRGRDDGRLGAASLRPLETISSRIINEIPAVNRVALDISSKPPATIEWE